MKPPEEADNPAQPQPSGPPPPQEGSAALFEPRLGLTWAQRAQLGGLASVISPRGTPGKNRAYHLIEMTALRRYLRPLPRVERTVDFGCGIGRFFPWLLRHTRQLWGLEVTAAMLEQARAAWGNHPRVHLQLFDGTRLPEEIGAPERVFCCGVLRDTRDAHPEVFGQIVRDWHERLARGGQVIELEMFVQGDPSRFSREFEAAGFRLDLSVPVLRYKSRTIRRIARKFRWPLVPSHYARREVREAASYQGADPADYLLVYGKP